MQSAALPTVLLVEDQPLTLMGMKISLENLKRFTVVGEAVNGEEAVTLARKLHPNVILMDVSLPVMDGIEASFQIKQELPRTKILMFTSHSSAEVVSAALGAGAEAYCLKSRSVEEVATAIDYVMQGNAWIDPAVADSVVRDQGNAASSNKVKLTNIEMRVLDLLRDGMTPSAIASMLKTNEDAVAATMRGIIRAFVPVAPPAAALPPPVTPPVSASSAPTGNFGTQGSLPAPFTVEPVALPAVGDIFAEKYLIEALIGTGGMGSVFRAVHMYMQRVVALKILHPSNAADQAALREFVHESMAVACVDHKNIIGVYDFGVSTRGEPYLVMELVEGETLEQILKREVRLTLNRFANIFGQVCDALIAAHDKGIVHCDLKPSNILIMQTDDGERVKLADFGLAKMLQHDVEEIKEGDLVVSGTPAFMSPEQCTGAKLDERTDIYSLGCVMFEAITGSRAFTGNTAKEIFAKHFDDLPPPVGHITFGRVPIDLEACIWQMLQVDPATRPQSMREIAQVIEDVRHQAESGTGVLPQQ